jgi:[acyl-carrier-protein] S-malonyltransferase
MARSLLERYPEAAGAVFSRADEVLGIGITELCSSGSAEDLRRTEITQPAVLATSLAVFAVLQSAGFRPSAVAGHSLGEYAALVTAGVLDAASAFRLVRVRGQLMAAAGKHADGAMRAVIGLPAEQIELLCLSSSGAGVVEAANFNEPCQTVISGETAAIEEVTRLAMAAGAEHIVHLNVDAPFHCSLMRGISAEFAGELDAYRLAEPRLPVFSAVTGDYVRSAAEARWLLRRQLTQPVRWTDTLQRAVGEGYDTFVEVGPGRVLSRFAGSIAPDRSIHATGSPAGLASFLIDRVVARQPCDSSSSK